MADVFSKSMRSQIMGKIHSANTQPEVAVRTFLHAKGFRFRVNVPALPGKPDIVLPRYRTVIFVHGCFWHGHPKCRRSTLPVTNRQFWAQKISQNRRRDRNQIRALQLLGWQVLVIWECQTKTTGRLKLRMKRLWKIGDDW
jgi:DNA mismatch endonuclease (patch repair protein)